MTQIADLPPSFTAMAVPREHQEPRTLSSYSSDVAIHSRAHNSVTRTSTVLAASIKPADKRSNQSDRRRSSSPGSWRGRSTQQREDPYSSKSYDRTRGWSPERSDRNHDRSWSRKSSIRECSTSAERSREAVRSKYSGSRDELPYLPPAEYKKFRSEVQKAKEELQKTKEDLHRKYFKSSPSSKPKEHVRSATSDHPTPDDNLSDSEIRALRASVSSWSDESSDDDSDGFDPSPDV